jgi:hypothetical protein
MFDIETVSLKTLPFGYSTLISMPILGQLSNLDRLAKISLR